MEESKYSTRVNLKNSGIIIYICKKSLKTKSLNKILPVLRNILSNYDSYAWNKEFIAKYKAEEEERIEKKTRLL